MGVSIPLGLSIWKSRLDINFIFEGLNKPKACKFCEKGYNRKGFERYQH